MSKQLAADVVLVHGTWARQGAAAWFSPDSDFSYILSSRFQARGIACRIFSHSWSGANSIYARRDAAIRLANRLEEMHQAAPNQPLLVIAHSHGGNIALQAVRSLSFEKAYVVTLATPFVSARTLNEMAPTYTIFMFPAVLVSFVAAIALMVLSVHYVQIALFDNFIARLIILAIMFTVVMLLTTSVYSKIVGDTERAESLLNAINGQSPTERVLSRLLIVRTANDEANLVLGLSFLAYFLSYRVLYWVSFVGAWLGFLFVVLFGFGLIFSGDILYKQYPRVWDLVSSPIGLLGLPVAAVAIISAIIPFLAAAARACSGKELFVGGLFVDVHVGDAPQGKFMATVANLAPASQRWTIVRAGEEKELSWVDAHNEMVTGKFKVVHTNLEGGPGNPNWGKTRLRRISTEVEAQPLLRAQVSHSAYDNFFVFDTIADWFAQERAA